MTERRQVQARAVSNGSGCIAQNNKSLLQAVYPFGPFETLACRQQPASCQAPLSCWASTHRTWEAAGQEGGRGGERTRKTPFGVSRCIEQRTSRDFTQEAVLSSSRRSSPSLGA